MELIRKVMPGVIVEKAEGRPLVALVSTPDVDFDGDVIMPIKNQHGNGWMVENFNRRGGRINWMHERMRPNLGKAKAVPSAEGLLLEVSFDLKDTFAAEIDRKYREGYLDEWSVGFNGIKKEPNGKGGQTFYESSLIEVSAVNVGCNPETETLVKSLADFSDRLRAVEDAMTSRRVDDDQHVMMKLQEIMNDLSRAARMR